MSFKELAKSLEVSRESLADFEGAFSVRNGIFDEGTRRDEQGRCGFERATQQVRCVAFGASCCACCFIPLFIVLFLISFLPCSPPVLELGHSCTSSLNDTCIG